MTRVEAKAEAIRRWGREAAVFVYDEDEDRCHVGNHIWSPPDDGGATYKIFKLYGKGPTFEDAFENATENGH